MLIFQWYFGLGLNLICVFVGTHNLEIQASVASGCCIRWHPPSCLASIADARRHTEIHAATGGEKGHRIGREIMCIIQTWKHKRVRKTQGGYIIMKTTNICLIINFVCSWICCLHTSCLKTILSYTTHWGRVAHMCVSKLNIIGSDNGLSHWSAPSHYLNQCWIIVR